MRRQLWPRVAVAGLLLLGLGQARPCAAAAAETDRYRAEVQARRDATVRTVAASNVRRHPKWFPHHVIAATALKGCDPALSAYMAGMLDTPAEGLPEVVEPDIFAEPVLVRFLPLFPRCIDAAGRERLPAILRKPQRLFGHGTINMASLTSSSLYLFAQMFPDLTWTNLDGHTFSSAQLMASYRPLLIGRFSKFLADGEIEMLSPTYTMANAIPTLNLVEFALDPEVKAFAEAYLVQTIAGIRVSSFRGVILPPYDRQNAQQRSGPAATVHPCVSSGQFISALYFGLPAIGPWDLDAGCEPAGIATLAVSSWVPPVTLSGFPDAADPPRTHQVTIPSFSQWDQPTRPLLVGTVHRATHFAIGSGNAIFEPFGPHTPNSTFLLTWDKPSEFNYVECVHPYWESNYGADAWSTIKVAPTFYPNATSRSSPFQQSFFSGGRGVLLFSIPQADPYPSSKESRFFAMRDQHKDALLARQNCHFPRDVDEYAADGAWLFIRAGGAYVGIETLGAAQTIVTEPTDPVVKAFINRTSEGRHVALFVVAADAERAGSFAEFRRAAAAIPHRHDASADTFAFQGEDGRGYRVRFDLRPEAGGTGRMISIPDVTADGAPVANGPGEVLAGPGYRIGGGPLHVETPTGTLDILVPASGPPRMTETLKGR